MKRVISTVLLMLLVSVLTTFKAQKLEVSDSVATVQTVQEKMREYLDWIANQSGEYDLDVPLPKVSYLSNKMLMLMTYGAEEIIQADQGEYELIEVLAVYSKGEVFLPEGFDHNNPIFQHTLFHEMVHHHQYLVYGESTCAGLREVEAYTIQTQWQDEANSPAERPNMLIPKIQEMSCKTGF